MINNYSSSSDSDSNKYNNVVLVSSFLNLTRSAIKLGMASVDTSLDYICDDIVSFNFVFITEETIKEFQYGISIFSTGHAEDAILNYAL